ncbi:MAG: substrate-binding domain-containing protein [Niabella sp.]|nr:substrate-binding domain-containing protein [Niabella sp.]
MKRIGILMFLSFTCLAGLNAQDHRFDPPWNQPPESSVMFTVPGIDNVPDFFGDINDPQLVLFFAGNQFMCVDELLGAFKKMYPQYIRVFAETLPPGILAKQIEGGSLTVGNMRITLKPDIYTAGKTRIDQMTEAFSDTMAYAYNKLAIMVQKGNPKRVAGLKDLARSDIRVAMPNPEFEGIGKRIEAAYVKAGGAALQNAIMKEKVSRGTTLLTQIHHRQTPLWILNEKCNAGPVWYSEAYYQQLIGHPIALIPIPDKENITATYMAGILKNAPHQQAAKDFISFLKTDAAKAVYRKYGFTVPE